MKIIGVIPARLDSQRLPRKVLCEIKGKLLVERVYEGAANCRSLTELWVATDSEEVLEACKKRKIPALMTSAGHLSGTDRIHEVAEKKEADVYVNIQGDEPLVRPEHLEALVAPFSSMKGVWVSTLKTKISAQAAQNPNVVKVATDRKGWALYFSRSAIPFDRDGSKSSPVYKHLGFYAYTPEALAKFHALPPCPLELTEKLEQLRFLENQIPIFVADTPFDTVGVDTEEDLRRVSELLKV